MARSPGQAGQRGRWTGAQVAAVTACAAWAATILWSHALVARDPWDNGYQVWPLAFGVAFVAAAASTWWLSLPVRGFAVAGAFLFVAALATASQQGDPCATIGHPALASTCASEVALLGHVATGVTGVLALTAGAALGALLARCTVRVRGLS